MKIRLLLFGLCVAFASSAQMTPSTFIFGPKVGIQTNYIKIIDDPSEIDSKLSIQYNIGVFSRLTLGKFSLQPEASFQIKGGNFENPQEKHTFRYLSTPIILGISPFQGLTLEAGPEFSWALNQGWKKDGQQQFGPDAKTDKAMVFGARFDLLDAFSMVSVHVRYTHGLDDVTDRMHEETTPFDFRNRTYSLSVTYNFSDFYKWHKKYGLKKKK